jgi:hypothetical protein
MVASIDRPSIAVFNVLALRFRRLFVNRAYDVLVADLRATIAALGAKGGDIGPSIYDTAQTLRLVQPKEGVWPALQWLLSQQRADGGWGDAAAPMARDVETLAAVLALHTYGTRTPERRAVRAGLAFIRRQCDQWAGPLPEDIPLAAELLLPTLIDQAREQGMDLDDRPYQNLRELGNRRRRLLAQAAHQAGTPLAHSWETWGHEPDSSLLDAAGSIGHSAPATAAWIRAARDQPHLSGHCQAAVHYLEQASAATGSGVPGVVGAVWPYPRNEQIVSLFTLLLAGLFDHAALSDVIQSQIEDLWQGLRPDGYGISDHFSTDGDLTAMSFAVLARRGYQPPLAVLRQFVVDDSCLTYKNEMQRSFSATTHAAYTLALLGDDPMPLLEYLGARRTIRKLWAGDKWHASWLYLTSHTIHSSLAAQRPDLALPALSALLDDQCPDGSWGVTAAKMEETAYGALALLGLQSHSLLPPKGQKALHRATRYMMEHYRPLGNDPGASWIAKGLYRPRRIAHIEETGVTLACLIAGYGDDTWMNRAS